MKKPKTTYQFPVIIEQDTDGYFVAECPDLPGCHTQGDTLEEAITNIRDAIELNLKVLKDSNRKIPKIKGLSLTSLEVSI